ncbi:MAG: hypothetical protein HC840_28830 [Leptolyngbyaceae cyanobacterium RM2_2_4]|nr:hypothetical protein [Leptolyngbyaceae cyanobacterium SM1_4_3]NJN90305.1 hypothetical protein [Leptolyngbyaceae cyanobacterium SL_5_14]NJO52740.1 hypothetical protein [Leptolyngbyaceae cyanobacterium RM2_2_4]
MLLDISWKLKLPTSQRFIKRLLLRLSLFIISLCCVLTLAIRAVADQLSVVFLTPDIVKLEGPLADLPLPGGIGDTFQLGGELNVRVAVTDPNAGSASVETDNPFMYFNVSIWPDQEFEFPCGIGVPEAIAGISSSTGPFTFTFGNDASCRSGEGYYLGAYSARVTDNNGIFPPVGFQPMSTIQRLIDADDPS